MRSPGNVDKKRPTVMTGSMIDPDKTEIITAATLERFVGQVG